MRQLADTVSHSKTVNTTAKSYQTADIGPLTNMIANFVVTFYSSYNDSTWAS